MNNAAPTIVSKSEFARLCNISAARLSQWIRDKQIFGDAFVGKGRSARINVPIAQRQLRRLLDPNQMTANGSATNLGAGPTGKGARPAAKASRSEADDGEEAEDRPDALDLTDERARLAKEQADEKAMRNAERRGELIDAAEAEARWTAEVIDMRTRTLRVIDDLRTEMPELTPAQVSKIDRLLREAMHRASQGDG